MPTLKISLPVYKLGTYSKLEIDGQIEVFSSCDNLSDAYEQLLPQIDHLIDKLQSQAHIAESIHKLEVKLSQTQYDLKSATHRLRRATKQYERLKVFLQQFGVSAADTSLIINNNVLSLDLPVKYRVVFADDDDDNDDDDHDLIPEF